MPRTIKVHTFKERGKWYTTCESFTLPDNLELYQLTREMLLVLNDGACPGLVSDGRDMHIVIIPNEDWGYPMMFPVRKDERPQPYNRIGAPGDEVVLSGFRSRQGV